MNIFRGQNFLEFAKQFKTDLNCKEYLGQMKWKCGNYCQVCGNKSYQVRKNLLRTCDRCSKAETLAVNTIFHGVIYSVCTAFFICFQKATTTKSLSAIQMGLCYVVNRIKNGKRLNFKVLYTIIYQVKSWISTTYSWVSKFNLNRCFNEFCFKVLWSQRKGTTFNNLITKMVDVDRIYQSKIICR